MNVFTKALMLIAIILSPEFLSAQTQEVSLTYDTSAYFTEKSSSGTSVMPSMNDTLSSIKGEIGATEIGGLKYTIPIDLLKGVNDFAPNIALNYSSHDKSGVAGWGWNIVGSSSITTGSTSKEIDGVTRGAQLDGNDPFYLDGQRLLHRDDLNYETQIFSKIKIKRFLSGEYSFVVTYTNGKIAKYKQVIKDLYMISEISDAFGNQVRYEYEITDEKVYLKNISYGGNSKSTDKYFVYFNYSSRIKPISIYSLGRIIRDTKVLNNIVIASPEDKNKPYRIYNLMYDYIQEGGVERLVRLDITNDKGQQLNPLKFTYTNKTAHGTVENRINSYINLPKDIKGLSDVAFGDFYGTGEMFPIYELNVPENPSNPNNGKTHIRLWNPRVGEITNYKKSRKLYAGKALIDKKVNDLVTKIISEGDMLISQKIDYLENGTDEIKFDFFDVNEKDSNRFKGSLKFLLPQAYIENTKLPPSQSFPSQLRYHSWDEEDPSVSHTKATIIDKKNRRFLTGDFNNDGLIDLLIFQPAGLYTPAQYYFIELGRTKRDSNYNSVLTPIAVAENAHIIKGDVVYPIEFDGDGIPEFLLIGETGNVNLLKFEPLKAKLNKIELGVKKLNNYTTQTPLIFGDFNGDGLTDFITPEKIYSIKDSKTENILNKMETDQLKWWLYSSTGKDYIAVSKDFTAQKLAYLAPSQRNNVKKSSVWSKIWSGKPDSYLNSEYGNSSVIAMDIDNDGISDLVSFRKFSTIDYKDNLLQSTLKNTLISTSPLIDKIEFHLVKPTNQSNFNLKTIPQHISLANVKMSPFSLIVSKTDFNQLNVHKSGLIIHDLLTRDERSYTINNDEFVEGQLKKIDNGSGVTQMVEYRPMTDKNNNKDESIYTYSKVNLPYPYYVYKSQATHYLVHKIHTQFNAKIISKEYRYHNGIQHLEGKGFIGFEKVSVSDDYESILNKEGKYTIKDVTKGVFWKVNKYGPLNDNALLYSTYGSLNETALFSKVSFVHKKEQLSNNRYIILNTQEDSQDFLYGSDFRKTYNYDSVNNFLLTSAVTQYNGAGTVTEMYSYTPEFTTGARYFYGKIREVKTTSVKGGESFSTKENYTYTPLGAVLQHQKYGNNTSPIVTDYTYYPFGGIEKETESTAGIPHRYTTKFSYDTTNRYVIKTETPDGLIHTANIDAFGKVLSTKDGLGLTSSTLYDSWGNAHTSIDYLGNKSRIKKSKSSTEGGRYDVLISNAVGSETISTFDAFDRVIQTKSKTLDNKWAYVNTIYDVYGKVVKNSEPYFLGDVIKYNYTEYDRLDRPFKFTDYNGKTTETCFEQKKVIVIDGSKKTSKWVDNSGFVVRTQDQGGDIYYKYHGNGSLKTINYEGVSTEISIDGWGNKTKLVDPSAGTYTYEYDNFGRKIKMINPKGGVTTYVYDELGRLRTESTTSTSEQTNSVSNYTYDNISKLPVSISGTYNDQLFTYETIYDKYYRIVETKETTPIFEHSVKMSYDILGRVDRIDTSTQLVGDSSKNTSTSIKNIYNNIGILTEQRDIQTSKIIWKLDSITAFGAPTQITYGNGYTMRHVYSTTNNTLQQIKHVKANQSVVDINYVYDTHKGVLLSRNNLTFGKSETYAYDDLNRLLKESVNGQLINEYTYDFRGRTTSNTEVGKYNYNPTDYQLESINLNEAGNGLLNNRGFATINYNSFKSPNEIYLRDKDRISYEYSILKGRYASYFGSLDTDKKLRPIRKYYTADQSVEIIFNGNNTQLVTYVTGSPYNANYIKIEEYKGNVRTTNNYYLHRDNQQSILAITTADAKGTVVEQRYFDAWGNLKEAKIAGIVKQPNQLGWVPQLLLDRGYTGHEHLYTVGLIHMNGRIYDPLLRRFLSPDNYVQDHTNTQNYNRYGYVLNNPLLYTDPSGESFVAAVVIGVAVAVVVNSLSNLVNEVPFWYGIGKSAVMGGVSGAISFGIGSVAVSAGSNAIIVQSALHGVSGGIMSEIEGGTFISGFASGAVSSLVGSAFSSTGNTTLSNGSKFSSTTSFKAMMIAAGGVAGGISSTIAGGDFWSGMKQGIITAGLNHAMHQMVSSKAEVVESNANDCDSCGEIWDKIKNGVIKFSQFVSAGEISRAEAALDIYETEGFNAYIYKSIGDAHYDERMYAVSGGNGTVRNAGGRIAAKGGFDAVGAFKNAISPFKGGNLTNAGRAVTKHPQYFGFESTEALMKVYRTPGSLNNLGSSTLKDILRNGATTTGAGGRYPNGWTTYTLPNGNAASWGLDGTFIGFRGIK
ncbi:RHS repeat-associated core domain-containing protein [Flavobacterium sp. NKUCC04_CG]|uniref:RHS repeat-associated core domain-containing protein n=1 Tax=Flavobacterium sp. NKUCC04_CG TaxID=2842121 RepID=UPI001C5AB2B0|nr:RHS repeat-associated core domain-containing protein [Flavobacterium sp. NKUCC04_CG]MBW3518531.1 hypothetical protein [Flavobacterium sp. NKUCC04_CG]